MSLLSLLVLLWVCCQDIEAITIADSRVRGVDKAISLGRGFSLTDYSVTSTCLTFEQRTIPSYNYDYSFMKFDHTGTSTEKDTSSFSSSVSSSFWVGKVEANYDRSSESTTTTDTKKTTIVAKMSMERYYDSIDDTTAELSPHAMSLINKKDLIGFYKACGTGFIRSIRRTNEVVAVFTLESTSVSKLEEASSSFSLTGETKGFWYVPPIKASVGYDSTSSSSSKNDDVKLTIEIQAFGIGLNKENDSSLIATGLSEFRKTMEYAFRSMQSNDIGIVKGVEIVRWVDNLQFQNAVEFESIKVKEFKQLTYEGFQKKCEECLASGDCTDFNGFDKCEGRQLKTEYNNQVAVLRDGDTVDMDSNLAVEKTENGRAKVADGTEVKHKAIVKMIQTMNSQFVADLHTQADALNLLIKEITQCQAELESLIINNRKNYYRPLLDRGGFEMKKRTIKGSDQVSRGRL